MLKSLTEKKKKEKNVAYKWYYIFLFKKNSEYECVQILHTH